MILTLLTILVSIGYAALNQNLSVSGEVFLRVKENIRISKAETSIQDNNGYYTYNPEYSKKGTKMYSTLPDENSSIIYKVEITNTTGAKYKFDSVTVSNTNPNVSCIPSVTVGSIIETGVSDFTVEVKYNEGATVNEDIQDICKIKYEFSPLDLIPPTLTAEIVSQNNKTAKVKITASDDEEGSGLSDDNIYKYCVSSSSEEAKDCTWTNYVNNEEFEISSTTDGEYYLFVYSVGDKAGNISDGKESIGEATNKLYLPLFNKVTNFDYTGGEQTYAVPASGYYKIEAWGAQGGSSILDGGTKDVSGKTTCVQDGTGKCAGGNGAYTQGTIYLNKNETLHLYVGGKGATGVENGTAQGGYNGGGTGDNDHNDDEANGAGGGATDIRLVGGTWNNDTSLNSRIMVAAGGSGAAAAWSGLPGGDLRSSNTNAVGSSSTSVALATQTTGYKFGIGQDGIYVRKNYPLSGAGGGYYGGFSTDDGSTFDNRGSGGSSFISGFAGVDAITSASSRTHTANTIHYSGKYFINSTMELGANEGNGKATITYISKTEPERENTRLNNVRYIKDCTNGSTSNDSNHWVELQAIYQGVNVAKGKSVASNNSVNSTPGTGTVTSIVDGILTSSLYSDFPDSKQCITVDLGNNYDLDEIAIWHYWQNNRTYFENETSVSSDNMNWVTVTMPTASETGKGRRISAYESYIAPLKLSLNLNGGKYVAQESTVIYYVQNGKSITLLTPTKTGYNFSGWTVSGTGSSVSGSTFTMGSADTTLTAKWTAASYTLTINPNGGTYNGSTSNTTMTVQYGKTQTIANPTRTGYVFNGWTVSGTGSKMSGTTFTMGGANATIKANWASAKPTYTYTGSSTLIDDGSGNWRIKFLTSGTLTFTNLGTASSGIDVFLVGGGGGAGPHGGGGGGGYTATYKSITVATSQSYAIVVGAGGAGVKGDNVPGNGGTSSAFSKSAAGGKAGGRLVSSAYGGAGGSGGGASCAKLGLADTSGVVGGSNGSDGGSTSHWSGGKGQRTTTREFGESSGTLYSGGGGGYCGTGGAGGGGSAATVMNTNGVSGTTNTGGGGGAGKGSNISGGSGGSGIVVIRNHR